MRSLLAALLLWCSGAAAAASTILVYGDSLSAAYGIPQASGWVHMLGERLKQARLNYTVTNASISGETSAGGAARIRSVLEDVDPAVVVVGLGANDGLRGLPVAQLKANLAAIVRAAKQRKAQVLLVGMRLPPNYGARYTQAFEQAFAEVAKEERVPFLRFLLEGVAERRELFLEDNLHPAAQAQPIILQNVWTALRPLLKQAP